MRTRPILLEKIFSFDNGRKTLVSDNLFLFSHSALLSQSLLLLSLQFDLFCDVGKGVRSLCPKRLLRPSTCVVGQAVTVAKRMMRG
jgi:hypothetical protein